MDRRNFVRFALAGSAAGIITPQLALAGGMPLPAGKLAGGLFYTEAAPGRWNKKVGGHLPRFETSNSGGKLQVQVTTGHEMKGHAHYIVKHMLLDQNMQVLAETMFDPMKDKAPISQYELSAYNGTLYAVSVCNKHDSWVNAIEV